LAISDIALLELTTTLSTKERIRLNISFESFLREIERGSLSYRSAVAYVCAHSDFPKTYPKDPADRIIGATALVEGLSLLIADREIRRSQPLHTVWLT
jgi:PIN domain nuclease of toxin-antitoxin system